MAAGRRPVIHAGGFPAGRRGDRLAVFQSISLGFECAFFLAGHLANHGLSLAEVFDRYEAFMGRQWLRVYMRTTMIKHNKDLLESVGDTFGLLAKLHIY